ncbi:MAG TPA: dTDP-glucose 4,6-dehydratase [Caulobacteraceae bacterium]|jgi:dTDP-glucose 4,6-dehydratase|nr:dTDP-glucose 4,6-dehydratase [Caulobacteraceae bacterium]
MKLLVTGGAGFIGSAVVRAAIGQGLAVVNVDRLAYSANPENLRAVDGSRLYAFERADIRNAEAMAAVFARHRPEAVLHLAAETHVDRSIDGPMAFVEANVVGTAVLLEAARRYCEGLAGEARARFRFHHVSTDEVFGALGAEGRFSEASPYDPSSPYSASKAASDHLVRAWGRTFGLPVLLTNTCNNYGPYQFPEKLIPVVILSAVEGRPIPLYGDGANVRDWLFVEDHAEALLLVLDKGRIGETYAIGGETEVSNRDLVERLCGHLDALRPREAGPHADLIRKVADRPGHDFRYALDAGKLRRELGWTPRTGFDEGLERTVRWYIDNPGWWRRIRERGFAPERLGLAAGG